MKSILLLFLILVILTVFLYYTQRVKEGFFADTKTNSIGTLLILDGIATIGNGFSVYIADNTIINTDIQWTEIQGGLFTVALAPSGDIFGTDSKSNIFYKAKGATRWTMIPGNLTSIDTDGTFVCGITPMNGIACATIDNAKLGKWTIIGNDAKWITISNNTAYVILTNGGLAYSTDLTNLSNIKWNFIAVTPDTIFNKISLDGSTIVAINNMNELIYADKNIYSATPNFIKVSLNPGMGNFVNISLQNKTIIAVDIEGDIWYTSNYKVPNWIKINNKIKTVMAVQYITKP